MIFNQMLRWEEVGSVSHSNKGRTVPSLKFNWVMYKKSKLCTVHFGLEITDDQVFHGTFINNGYFCFILLHNFEYFNGI